MTRHSPPSSWTPTSWMARSMSPALEAQGQVATLGGQTLMIASGTVTAADGTVVSITTPDQAASNGFVHGVSGLLFVPTPPTAPGRDRHQVRDDVRVA